MSILAFEVTRHLLELRSESDGIEVGGTEAQRSTVRQKFWALEQYTQRGLKIRDALRIRCNGESSRSPCRVNQVQVAGHDGPMPTVPCSMLLYNGEVKRVGDRERETGAGLSFR